MTKLTQCLGEILETM